MVTPPDQGLHLVAHAPDALLDDALQRLAKETGLTCRRLSEMYVGAPPMQGLVIGFSGFEPNDIGAAAARAASLMASLKVNL
jgi:GntR family transcriptional regulator/MocR family aminotransferase